MVNFCAVPGCSNRSDPDVNVSYHRLPVNKPSLLKQWIHKIGRENLPILDSTRVCSDHFVNSKGRKLRPDEYPTLNLPSLPTQVSVPPPRRQLIRYSLPEKRKRCNEDETEREVLYSNIETNTELTWFAINEMENKLNEMTKQVEECRLECNSLKEKEHLRLNNIKDDNE